MRVQELFSLEGKVALVTGGSRGLGLEIAVGLGEAGARVAITARRDAWLAPAAKSLAERGIDAEALICDVSQLDQVTRAVAAVTGRFGGIDVLVNNAGISWGAPAEQMPLDRWQQVLATNVTGTFMMSQAVFPAMAERKSGAIINIASVAGLAAPPPGVMDAVGYTASKGAIIAMTRELAVKWADHGIRVNAVAPGFFPTRMSEGVLERATQRIEQAVPMRRVGRDNELKGVVVFLASAAASYVTGHVLVVDGGMLAM